MTKFERFDHIVAKAMLSLPNLNVYRDDQGAEYIEDPNLKDIYHLADTFRSDCEFIFDPADAEKLTSQDIIAIVEIVEDNLLRPSALRPVYRDPRISDPLLIRVKDQQQIVSELSKVAESVAKRYPPLGSFEESLMKALYMWYSCLCIGKECRHRDIHGVSPQNRMEVHD